MLYFQRWLLVLILGACALGVIFALPNAFAPTTVAQWPSVLRKQISLGLDLRGGSYLLYEVDFNAAERERLNNVVDDLRTQLLAAKIGYTNLAATADHVSFTVTDPTRYSDVRDIATKNDPGMDVQISGGTVTLTPNQTDLAQQQSAMISQAIEVVRRRIDPQGTK